MIFLVFYFSARLAALVTRRYFGAASPSYNTRIVAFGTKMYLGLAALGRFLNLSVWANFVDPTDLSLPTYLLPL